MANEIDVPDDLIERYIVPDPDGLADRARLAGSGVPVWAIIGYLRGYDIDQTAADYEVSREEVEAALAYYDRHRAAIDAWLTLNDAAFTADGR